jgi:hypothetical protein
MLEGDLIRLTGRSVHGKNRVREHGGDWVVTGRHTRIRPMPQHKRSVKSVQTGSERWISLIEDKDFLVEPII